MRRWATPFGIAAAVLAASAVAEPAPVKRPLIPATKLFPYLDRYWKLPPAERTLFAPAYMVKRNGAPARDLKLWLVDGAARESIPVTAEGRLDRLPSAAQLSSGKIEVDAPASDKFGVSLVFAISLKPSTEFHAADFARAVRQADAGVHKAAGMMSALVPKLDRVIFRSAEGATAVSATGARVDLPSQGAPVADLALLDRSVTVRFSRPPTLMEVDGPPRK